jgi:uncharacterized protein YjeT (DUF2065 family)
MSQTLLQALSLVLVIEGILPFLSPRLWRQSVARAALSGDRVIRALGLGAMLLGVAGLYLLNGH